MMTNKVGIGIIGAGRIFEQHARACGALSGRVRLLAIAEVDEARARKAIDQFIIPLAFRDYGQLLVRDDIDLVTVCTPPVLHEQILIEALEAGKFVICEKPLAHTLESADRILAVAARHPGMLSTVYQFRYLPEVQRALWLRDEGFLGKMLFGRFSRFARWETPAKLAKPGTAAKPAKKRNPWWGQWEKAGGGMAMTQLIHELDLMCHIFGRATEVMAGMETLREPIESEDTCAAIVRFENDALVCCYGTMTSQRSNHAFDVIGDRASVHFPWAVESMDSSWREQCLRSVLRVYPLAHVPAVPRGIAGALRAWRSVHAPKPPAASSHTPYLAAVVNAIIEGQPLPIGPQEARASLEICTAIYASALSGQSVVLPLDHTNSCYSGLTTAAYDGRQRQGRNARTSAAEQIMSA